MLVIFNLDWNRFAIDQQLAEAHHYLEEMVEAVGLTGKVIFNCASLGAGEKVLHFAARNRKVERDTLDYLRWHHHQVKTALRKDEAYNANRDVSEMLHNLKRNGHKLAAVCGESTNGLEGQLKISRTLDFFEDGVFGADRRPYGLKSDYTLAAMYRTAAAHEDKDMAETLVVSDSPEAIEDALPVHPCAVVGYLDPYTEWSEQGVRLKEMVEAGANYTAVGGQTVSNLPFHLNQRAKTRGFLATMIAGAIRYE